jgi:HEAT repeats
MAKFNPRKEINIDNIIDIIKGKNRHFPLGVAIDMFIKSEYSDKEKLLEILLDNNDESFKTRYLAATYLGRLNSEKSRDILKRNLSIKDERILSGILKALTFIGDEDALQKILNLRGHSNTTIQRQVSLVASLISYRLNLKDYDLEYPSENYFTDVPQLEYPFKLTLMKKNDIKGCFESLKYELTGIEFSSDPVYNISFDDDKIQYVILFNKNINKEEKKSINDKLKEKQVVGVISKKNIEYNSYSIAYFVLSSTNSFGQTNIFVTTTDGVLHYAGIVQIIENKIHFSLKSISEPGILPLYLEGNIVDNKLKINTFRFEPKILKTMNPAKDDDIKR